MTLPDFSYEDKYCATVCGVDEVGRGPWAGPVVTAAVILDRNNVPAGITDSKKLSAKKRELIFDHIIEFADVGIGMASVEEIDNLNILQATKLAMRRAVDNLSQTPDIALVDGNQMVVFGQTKTELIVKGDSKSLSIAAASIVAKVTRDRLMSDLALAFPYYAWEKNAGYGTKAHQEGLAAYGITDHHRKSFKPIASLIEAK